MIGVRQDSDGIYYWTLDGDWLLDADGNKIKAQGIDGKDGQDGQDGKDGQDGADGITPQLKIEGEYWYISYDNGASWTQLGKATGEDGKDGQNGADGKDGQDGDSFFKSVTQDEENVYFELADGTLITLPKGTALNITFDESDLVVMSAKSTRSIGYSVSSMTDKVTVEVTSSADIKAKVIPADNSGKTGTLQVSTGSAIDEYSKVIVFVSNGDKVIMRSITFEEAGLVVEENATKIAPAEGGEVVLEFLTNVKCEASIPEEAQEWISVVPATRAMEKHTITLKLEPNEGYNRVAIVTIQSLDSKLKLEYLVEQKGDLEVDIDPTQIPDNEIWYRTTDGKIYNIHYCTETFGSSYKPFDVNIVSNKYQDGIGVIKCNTPITCINYCAFRGYNVTTNNITELYLPNCIETISGGAIEGTELTTLHIPENLKQYGGNSNMKMKKFTGKYVSDDGRCVIIDEVLCAFAPKDVSEYIIPQGVRKLQGRVMSGTSLRNVVLSEGLEEIGYGSFMDCTNLKTITFPSTLQTIEDQAFEGCHSIEGFYGNDKFHTDDNKCLICYTESFEIPNSYGKWIQLFAGKELTEYTIPEGIIGILSEAFSCTPNLKHLTLPSSLVDISIGAFGLHEVDQTGIEAVYGENTSEDHKCFVRNGELKHFIARKGIIEYNVGNDISSIGGGAFAFCPELQKLTMGDNVIRLGANLFAHCPKLTSVTLSANIEEILGNPFENCGNLQSVYLRSLVPPLYVDANMHGISENLQILVPSQSLSAYQHSGRSEYQYKSWSPYLGWYHYRDYLVGYNYNDHPTPDLYISSDYSQDGVVTTLQTATKGNGIDIVLMGDAYSDRQIADGTYRTDMEYIYKNLFTEEPYKSFKDYFNVYYVNVVSITEDYGLKGANSVALGGYFGDGTLVGGNDYAVFDYALKAISEEEMDEALLIVAMDSDDYAGTCYMYLPDNSAGYGNGVSVSYFPRGGDETTFAQLLHHEACGHGFAKLADEYAYEYMGATPSDYISQIQTQQADWGWWKNVDFTNDLSQIRWSRFLNDSRYQYDGLGAYEGGLTYWSGVWRPTENSIMRYNTGGFNAPSREAIYYRIHKLAYGNSWQYDYEEFVEWDARNRKTEAEMSRAPYRAPANFKHTAPPVVIKGSWRDAKPKEK